MTTAMTTTTAMMLPVAHTLLLKQVVISEPKLSTNQPLYYRRADKSAVLATAKQFQAAAASLTVGLT
ncbi:hypothetical protein BSLG_009693 [Batrachochytrium salamandrivorans]|nr:hypothetical protein BSLG_009693 [Batrachochytrium salamandrivorans]